MAAVKADYYEVLGVPRDADEETIRKAFHAHVRECHPDVAATPEDHRRFRELAEAYGVLSKPASRLLYDRYGYRGRGNQGLDESADMAETPRPRGDDVHLPIKVQWFEAEEGTKRLVRYEAPTECATCDGRGVLGEPDPHCPDCRGTGQVRDVSYLGGTRILRMEPCPPCGVDPCDECDRTGIVEAERRLRVRIPAGVEGLAQLRVAGEGGAAGPGGVPGDLLLDVDVVPEPRDRSFVRYIALVGLLAAIGLLVAYLLLG